MKHAAAGLVGLVMAMRGMGRAFEVPAPSAPCRPCAGSRRRRSAHASTKYRQPRHREQPCMQAALADCSPCDAARRIEQSIAQDNVPDRAPARCR